MARFTPTQAEKDALSYLDWDDVSLGRFTKYVACTLTKIKNDQDGLHRVTAASCAMMLVSAAFDANADDLTLKLTDHVHKDVHTGDWLVTVHRISERQAEPGSSGPVPTADP